eukprot:jgi/Mesen1/6126/ME000313S05248
MKDLFQFEKMGLKWPSMFMLLLTFGSMSQAAVFAVDYGAESIKVAVVNPRPGQSPISIAINEMSKRKSPTLVAISNGDRLMSEEAAGIVARYPDRVYSRARDLVGKPYKTVEKLLKANYLHYDVLEDTERDSVKIRTHDGKIEFSPEELVAMTLNYARELAELHSKTVIKDAIVSVPAFFGQKQRQAILDAAQVAGVNVMALINEHAGAALQYGIDKDFSNASRHVVLYDMGAASTYAAVVHYSSYTTKERGKDVSINQFQVKGVRWDADLGGQSMEARLLEHFADEFAAKVGGGVDIRASAKAMAKLKKEVKRTKEVLSANTEAPLNVEGLYHDIDFRTSITRSKFEELCGDLWARAVLPLKDVLADANVSVADLEAVELLGGATRVPRLQAALSEFVGGKGLDRHLDADEATVLGASLAAANMSDGFKLNRKLGMLDGLTHGVLFQVHPRSAAAAAAAVAAGEERGESDESASASASAQLLFPRLKKVPFKVIRSLKHQTDDFNVILTYDPAGELPPGTTSSRIAELQVSGVANTSERYAAYNLTQPFKTSLHFSLTRSGLVALEKAEMVVEFSEWYQVAQPVNASSGTGSTNATASEPDTLPSGNGTNAVEDSATTETGEGSTASSSGNSTGSGSNDTSSGNSTAAAETVMVSKLRRRIIRVPLKVTDVSEAPLRPLPGPVLAAALTRMEEMQRREADKRATAEAKNSLEAYIYATKDKLEVMEEELKQVAKEAQLQAFRSDLTDVRSSAISSASPPCAPLSSGTIAAVATPVSAATTSPQRAVLTGKGEGVQAEDWLYMDGEDAPADDFRKKLAALKVVGDKLFF